MEGSIIRSTPSTSSSEVVSPDLEVGSGSSSNHPAVKEGVVGNESTTSSLLQAKLIGTLFCQTGK
jgi:hypothetical protein